MLEAAAAVPENLVQRSQNIRELSLYAEGALRPPV